MIANLFFCHTVYANPTKPLNFKEKLIKLNWISFYPTSFNPEAGIYPVETSIRQDLRVLRNHGFNGIITYGSEKVLGQVPRLAKEEGFLGVIMGIWDFRSEEEIFNAHKGCSICGWLLYRK